MLFLVAVVVALGFWLRPAQAVSAPPILFQVPGFTLVDQAGVPFGIADLHGAPWVANFFFTSCPTVCPGHMASLATLQERLAAAGSPAAIVSVSVDPATDTPERLEAYGGRLGADSARWHLLTGDEATIRSLVEGGFLSAMGSPRPVADTGHNGHTPPLSTGKPIYEISHANRFFVVDGAGRVRALVAPEGDPVSAILAVLASLAVEAP